MVSSLLPLAAFAVAASITPGPNNVMVATSAAHHGFRATVPHILGIAVGFTVMIVLVGAGVAVILLAVPMLATGLRWVSVGWLLVLAWRLAWAGAPGSAARRPPMGFWAAALFQWVNPKAWMIALAANGAFISAGRPLWPQVLLIAGTFCLLTLPCMLPWAALGSFAGRLLHSPVRVRAFNVTMAVLMVASTLPVAFE